MKMDFKISSDFSFEMGALLPREILTVLKVFLIINQALASPVWMPQFLSGGQGRNIRHLPCVSRRTGEQGICMFAYTCMKSNGTHLGTCIDRFYFGSCCKLKDTSNDLLLEHPINFPVVSNNRVTSPYYPDESKIQNLQTTSLQNLFNTKFTVSSADNYYPYKTSTPKVETTTHFSSSHYGSSTNKTVVDLAQHLATETYFLTPTTEKIYVPIYSSLKPNKTESSSSGLFSTHGSSSSGHTDTKKPTTQNQSFFESSDQTSTSTQSYFLSTFQIVHNEDGNAPNKTSPSSHVKLTTVKPVSEVVTSWTPVKIDVTTPAPKKNVTFSVTPKPVSTTVTKKPIKPVKPVTTTRKPPSKKPTPKPSVKPVSTSQTAKPTTPVKKPVQVTTTTKSTTPRPSAPSKKPTQPTKKPPALTIKTTTARPQTTYRPTILSTKHNSTSSKPTKPLSTPTTTTNLPYFTTIIETTSEVVFTKPGNTLSTPQTNFGITTFRPDLTPTTKYPALITGPHLTTFNYVSSEGVKGTTPYPSSVDGGYFSTISNEIPSSLSGIGSIPEAQEENTNIIFQQAGSTSYPGSFSQMTSTKPNDTTLPFFPEASKPGLTNPPWIQIVQSTTSESTASTTPKSTSTTNRPYTGYPLFAGLNTSDYTEVCGRRIFPESRVVGGEKSSFGKWPWQISLRQWRTSTYLHKCGAALLNENWAITAAHCVENVPPSDLLLRLGEHDLSTEDEPYGFQERRVQIVASHPQFDPRTFEYDLALLRFYEPVKFQPNIIPVCVPEDSTNFVGQTAYVTGWGRLYEDGPLPSILQEVSVPVINNTLCENMYRSAGYIEHIPEIFICAGWKKGGFDSCEGDSGGPMVIQRPDKRWLLAGVISWGIGCAEPNQPGVYTRISEFREWIHQILQF